MDFGNVLVIIMCVIVVGVGLYTFLSEYILNKQDDAQEKDKETDQQG